MMMNCCLAVHAVTCPLLLLLLLLLLPLLCFPAATVLSWFMTSQLPLLLLAAFSFWIPQIWHNILNTARQPLAPSYILVSTAARLLLPVYLLCCPLNLLQLTPQPWLAAVLLIWVGLQVAVLLLQHYCHPHIILPASWAPVRYNYHRIEVSSACVGHCLNQSADQWNNVRARM
jgi:hypothetical protein